MKPTNRRLLIGKFGYGFPKILRCLEQKTFADFLLVEQPKLAQTQ